ncbi:MAG TPA: sigma-54 dependent transcriptional regulator [Longimicrobiales bacterium]
MSDFSMILGASDAAEAIRAFGRRAAQVDAPVLLTGESGTGKGLLARAIHRASRRAGRPFVAVNCAGVPETLFESEFFGHARGAFTGAHDVRRGLFEQANGGTLFLDEVADLPAGLQAKLLTALEDGEIRRLGAERPVRVDVRLIAATGADLERRVVDGRFRRDLYHRLLVLSFRLPALRERDGDLDFLLAHFLDHFSRRYERPLRGFAAAAAAKLHAHPWPGNIRELAHAVEAAVLACDETRIGLRHLPDSVRAPAPAPAPEPHRPPGRYSFHGSPDEERRRIQDALRHCHGNKTRAAARLGMARNTLRKKLRTLGIDGEAASETHELAVARPEPIAGEPPVVVAAREKNEG